MFQDFQINRMWLSVKKLQTDTESIHQWDKATQRNEAGLAEDKSRRTVKEKHLRKS